jgi:hypothetical protein
MDAKYVVAPIGIDESTLDKVLSATMNFKHMDIVEESDGPSPGDENKHGIYNKYNVVDVNVRPAISSRRPTIVAFVVSLSFMSAQGEH